MRTSHMRRSTAAIGAYVPLTPRLVQSSWCMSMPTVFVIPLLVLSGVYLDLMCFMPQQVPGFSQKRSSVQSRSLALSIFLLVMLCLPLHITHALLLFAPSAARPRWTSLTASVLFQMYSLVPPLLFTNTSQQVGFECSLLSAPTWPRGLSPLESNLWGVLSVQWKISVTLDRHWKPKLLQRCDGMSCEEGTCTKSYL